MPSCYSRSLILYGIDVFSIIFRFDYHLSRAIDRETFEDLEDKVFAKLDEAELKIDSLKKEIRVERKKAKCLKRKQVKLFRERKCAKPAHKQK